jgi:hypothetical protein
MAFQKRKSELAVILSEIFFFRESRPDVTATKLVTFARTMEKRHIALQASLILLLPDVLVSPNFTQKK